MTGTKTEPWKLTAVDAVAQLRDGHLTPQQLVEASLLRVKDTDGALNAVPQDLRGYDQALLEARRLMARYAMPAQRPPWYLHGLPIMIKDLTSVAGLKFVQGSRVYRDNVADRDDPLVTALKHAGAIIVAKTNVPEFGAGAQTWNDVFGTTRNPWDTRLTPGGSSGGSTAALASGQVWLATGTDVGGSLRIPASFCGVLGLRPTPGVVPQDGLGKDAARVKPGALYNVAGPMARTAADLALLMDAMTAGGYDSVVSFDPFVARMNMGIFTAAVQPGAWPAIARRITGGGGSMDASNAGLPLKLAYSVDLGLGTGTAPVDPEVAEVCRSGAEKLAAALGAQFEPGSHPDVHDCVHIFRVLRAHRIRGLTHLLEEPAASLVKEEMLMEVRRGIHQAPELVEGATLAHGAYCERFMHFLQEHQLLALPCVITPPFDADTKWLRECQGTQFKEYTDWLILTYAVSLVPCPALSLPVGFTKAGLPVGLQLVAAPGNDDALFAAAAAFERAHPACRDALPLACIKGSGQPQK